MLNQGGKIYTHEAHADVKIPNHLYKGSRDRKNTGHGMSLRRTWPEHFGAPHLTLSSLTGELFYPCYSHKYVSVYPSVSQLAMNYS